MKTWIKVVSAILITGLVIVCLLVYFMFNKPQPDYEKVKAVYTLPAIELYKAYKTDKKDAGERYGGKVIEVTGQLSKLEVADSVTTCVFVFNQGTFGDEGVRCSMLPRFRAEAGKLIQGTEVKLKGYCTGFNDTDVILEKSSIVK